MEVATKHQFEDNWLAKALVYYKIIDKTLYEELAYRNTDQRYFYRVLTDNDFLNDDEIRQFVKVALQIPTVNLDKVDAESDVIKLIPEDLCQRFGLLPLQANATHIAVALSNPFNLDAENEIEYLTRKYVKKYFAPVDIIKEKIGQYYSPEKVITDFVSKSSDNLNIRFVGDTNFDSTSPVVKLVNQIIGDSIAKEASDIHIEPKEKSVQVRFRIDGVLRNELEVPRTVHSALASRIKIISNLNIAETRKPQDGKAKVLIEDKDVDLRISILPTSFGEKVVIRILDKRNASVSLDQMGIKGYNRDQLEKCFNFKQGMVLVTGPTGSGKSTTLYAAINRIRSTTNNILTIEDPIEYMFDGINQVQVNEKAGVTFASALRSFLRQDPDVILVGEIRDKETAEIGIQASLTGHLVLSTLHTNDTFTTVTRLKDMGVDKFKITEALQAVVAQRLVRRLCKHCKHEVNHDDVDPKLLTLMSKSGLKPQLFEPKGCARCGYTGYKGRIGVYEILLLDDDIRDLIAGDASVQKMRRQARKNGFRNLFEDGIELVASGITDYNEIIRVINPSLQQDDETEAAHEAKETAAETEKLKLDLTPQPATATPPAAGNEKPELAEEQGTPEKAFDLTQQEFKILVTDDSSTTRLMVSKIIQRSTKWQVFEAEDGEKALDVIEADPPDLIILDVMMPNMDGYELLQELKARKEYASIPVLIFTALKTSKSEEKVFQLGADGFLVKPIDPKVLIKQMENALEHQQEMKNFREENPFTQDTVEDYSLKLA